MKRHVTYTEEVCGTECELTFPLVEGADTHEAKIGDKIVFAYLVLDDDGRDIDDLLGDSSGRILRFDRSRRDIPEGMAALGNTPDGDADLDAVWASHEVEATKRYVERCLKHEDVEALAQEFAKTKDTPDPFVTTQFVENCLHEDAEYHNWDCVWCEGHMKDVLTDMWNDPKYWPGNPSAQLLAVYSHSGEHWSLSGQGMQCQWDTSNCAGVWLPPDGCPPEKEREYCQSFLDDYNNILSGAVYGCVVEWFDEDGKAIDNDACWGFVGDKYAEEALKSVFFEPKCKELQKEYDEDVRTQCGKQEELV
jgi:hypothetical protein